MPDLDTWKMVRVKCGHVMLSCDQGPHPGSVKMLQAADLAKDQSYFLSRVPQVSLTLTHCHTDTEPSTFSHPCSGHCFLLVT